MSAELKASRNEHSLILTLSNPGKRNALHPEIAAAAIETLATAERDESVAAVILTGAGEWFCDGADPERLRELRLAGSASQATDIDAAGNWIEAVMDCPKPVIAAVEGGASASGFALMLACDLIVAGTSARFAMPQASWGLSPDAGATWLMSHHLPRHLASATLLLGKPLAAAQLAEIGVITELVPDGKALEAALALADTLAGRSRETLQRTKLLLREARGCSFAVQMRSERQQLLESLRHRDAAEGLQAALEGRKPSFR